jgi:phospholipid/cholesterol/gamma-HCH transport system substrate-binding protein
MSKKAVETFVGLFMLIAVLALIFLAIKVSGLSAQSALFGKKGYTVSARFSNIGNLKVRSPIRVAGVQIGSVTAIRLSRATYEADVSMRINKNIKNLPLDSSASIETSGLLGDNYISITPGYSTANLKNGSIIKTTYAATSIQSLISTFMSSSSHGGDK